MKTKLLIVLTALLLSSCSSYVNKDGIDKCEKLCADNSGVYIISVDSTSIACKCTNGALFSNVKQEWK